MGKAATAPIVAKPINRTPAKVAQIVPTTPKKPTAQPLTLRSETVMCTPAIAKQLRAACHFERQRGLSEHHIARLAEEMRRGSFIEGTQVFLGVLPDRHMLILNGNHTLEAVSKSGIPTALTFTFCPVKDENDAGRLYAQFDIHRTRSWGDAYKAYGFDEDIAAQWINKSGSALGVIASGFRRANGKIPVESSRDVRAKMMREYSETIHHLVAVIRSGPVHTMKMVKRRGVLAVALETMRWQPSAAAEFWRSFVMDDGLRSGDPAKALLNYIRNFGIEPGGNSGIVLGYAAALAWNAFYTKKPIQVLRVKEGPFVLAGTPWDGKDYAPPIPEADKSYHGSVKVSAVVKPSFSTGVSYTKEGDKPVVLYENAA